MAYVRISDDRGQRVLGWIVRRSTAAPQARSEGTALPASAAPRRASLPSLPLTPSGHVVPQRRVGAMDICVDGACVDENLLDISDRFLHSPRVPVLLAPHTRRSGPRTLDGRYRGGCDRIVILRRESAPETESPRAAEADLIVSRHPTWPDRAVTVSFRGHLSTFTDNGPGSVAYSWTPTRHSGAEGVFLVPH